MFDREIENPLLFLFAQGDRQRVCAARRLAHRQFVELLRQRRLCGLQRLLVTQADDQLAIIHLARGVSQVTRSQKGGNFLEIPLHGRLAHRLGIDFQQEVHAAAQIQTQRHGLGAQAHQPTRCPRRQAQSHDIVAAEDLTQRLSGFQLAGIIRHACEQLAIDDIDLLGCDLGAFQNRFHARDELRIHGFAGISRNLNRRIFAKNIGQCVDHAHGHNGQQHQPSPQGVLIHQIDFSEPLGRTLDTD